MNLGIYENYLLMKGASFFAGVQEDWAKTPVEDAPDTPLMAAFLADDDIQQISYASSNLGIARTWQKVYRAQDAAARA